MSLVNHMLDKIGKFIWFTNKMDVDAPSTGVQSITSESGELTKTNTNITVDPVEITRLFSWTAILLVVAHVGGRSLIQLGGKDYYGIVGFFNLDHERTLATFYSYTILLFSATLLALIAAAKYTNRDSSTKYWAGLSGIFLFLTMDEMLVLHERLIDVDIPWMVIYGFLGLVFLMVYRSFITSLPFRIRRLFLLAGVIYVSGAGGVESLAGRRYYLYGGGELYQSLIVVEETLEMIGIVIFIHALLIYIVDELAGMSLVIERQRRV